jgi:hypothetical protein
MFHLLVSLICVWLAWNVHRVETQRRVVRWVAEAGGIVRYDYELDGKGQFVPDAEPPGPDWLRDRIGVD